MTNFLKLKPPSLPPSTVKKKVAPNTPRHLPQIPSEVCVLLTSRGPHQLQLQVADPPIRKYVPRTHVMIIKQ